MKRFSFLVDRKRSKIEMTLAFKIIYPDCELMKCSCIGNQAKNTRYRIVYNFKTKLEPALVSLRIYDIKDLLQ
jgi:hypothetical protein